eukprot:767978-Hanusia_phi.AAC.6
MLQVPKKVPGKVSQTIVDRTGKYSIFRALGSCCLTSIRNGEFYVRRNGMTEIEFNKHLEKNGLLKKRAMSPYTEIC